MLGYEPQKPTPDFNHNPFLKNGTEFQQKIWRLISLIKPGETTTYGKLAIAAGSPGGGRAVGQACNQNPLALIIPCHRVVAKNGPGGFAADLAIKLQLLQMEKNFGDTQGVQLNDIKYFISNC
ncbi:MAG: MGMT family protein [Desulfobulbaceae bacterium]|nr:MGMT family protein [Desulfobulbaceae bacterium]